MSSEKKGPLTTLSLPSPRRRLRLRLRHRPHLPPSPPNGGSSGSGSGPGGGGRAGSSRPSATAAIGSSSSSPPRLPDACVKPARMNFACAKCTQRYLFPRSRGSLISWSPAVVLLGFSGPAVCAYEAGPAAATSTSLASMEVDEDTPPPFDSHPDAVWRWPGSSDFLFSFCNALARPSVWA